MSKLFYIIPSIFLSLACSTNIFKRASLFTFEFPSITLTPGMTIAERQLIGRNAVIEKNGWLLSFSQTTKSSTNFPLVSNLWRYNLEIDILNFYEKQLFYFKEKDILGESHVGYVKLVPRKLRRQESVAEELALAKILQTEVNRARKWLSFWYSREKDTTALLKLKREKEVVSQKNLSDYFILAKEQKGQWIFLPNEKWVYLPKN